MKNKKFFIAAIVFAIIFEWLRVYFIMPMPGSQQINSIDLAYFLHSYRWIFRIVFIGMMLLSFSNAWKEIRKTSIVLMVFLGMSAYLTNFPMSADTMFKMMGQQHFANEKNNLIDTNRLIIGVVIGNEAKAYPINIIAHHHQVKDTIAGQEILVTYCSVCRTGKVYNPIINGKSTDFRLVGMDHFNAMFEDPETKSWWRQVNGTCIAGKLKGEKLKEVTCYQTTLKTWINLYPQTLILQQDPNFKSEYKGLEAFDEGSSKSSLTGRNKKANEFKSWVVWIKYQDEIACEDWSVIEKNGYIMKEIGNTRSLILSNDKQSLFAFDLNPLIKAIAPQRISSVKINPSNFEMISNLGETYRFNYKGIVQNFKDSTIQLPQIQCTQEFKHSFDEFTGKIQ